MGYPMDFKLETDGTQITVSATCVSREEVDCVIQAMENAKAILPAPPKPPVSEKSLRTIHPEEDTAAAPWPDTKPKNRRVDL